MFDKFTKRTRDSIAFSAGVIGLISTILSILGYSLGDCINATGIWERIGLVIIIAFILYIVAYFSIGYRFKRSVNLSIRNTDVEICCGDIFQTDGYRVIGCDTHFNTRADDTVISKKSLHGQLILNHGKKEEIEVAVKAEAVRLGLQKNESGQYDFELGSVIQYESSVDRQTYLMLAMTELDQQYKARTNMAKFEHMLMKMWSEIDRVYASNNVVLPLLGTGISRFDDGPKDASGLLRCMLCTLNSSGVSLNSKLTVVIFGDKSEIPLYEYKDLFRVVPGNIK
jgi:hypothetical protein